jgi:hypothetical protein
MKRIKTLLYAAIGWAVFRLVRTRVRRLAEQRLRGRARGSHA